MKLRAIKREKAKRLRDVGYSLSEISARLIIPKTTVHDWVAHVKLNDKAQARIALKSREARDRGNWEKYQGKYRGKYSKMIEEPEGWNPALVSIVAHFLFDGHLRRDACEYYNSNHASVTIVSRLIKNLFNINRTIHVRKTGVYRAIFYSAEMSRLMKKKKIELIDKISYLSKAEKLAFLRAFFDDEGNITCDKKYNINRVRGYQKDRRILILCQKLLKDFGIFCRLEKDCLVIGRKDDLIKFKEQVNFSQGLFIYNRRSNTIWEKPISKRKLLELITM